MPQLNHTRGKLADGRPAFGTVVGFIQSPSLMRMIAAAGFDFAMIDTEHSSFDLEVVSGMCQMARAAGLVPVVRPYSHDGPLLRRLLGLGAMGLMCPGVESRTQVEALRRVLAEPAEGPAVVDYEAGMSGAPAAAYFRENVQLIVQCETRLGVERIDEILDGGGVDVVEVGRTDLSHSLGHPDERRHPEVLAALDTITASCQRHGVAVGAMCDSAEDAEDLLRRGVRWLMYSSDTGILMRTYAQGAAVLRAAAETVVPVAAAPATSR